MSQRLSLLSSVSSLVQVPYPVVYNGFPVPCINAPSQLADQILHAVGVDVLEHQLYQFVPEALYQVEPGCVHRSKDDLKPSRQILHHVLLDRHGGVLFRILQIEPHDMARWVASVQQFQKSRKSLPVWVARPSSQTGPLCRSSATGRNKVPSWRRGSGCLRNPEGVTVLKEG